MAETTKIIVEGQPAATVDYHSATREYKLRAGKEHTHDGVALKEGDTIHLTEDQGTAFKDKLEPVDPKAPFKVHTLDEVKKTSKANADRGTGRGVEAQQAQDDKAKAEAKASAASASGKDATFKGTEGTLTKDPVK